MLHANPTHSIARTGAGDHSILSVDAISTGGSHAGGDDFRPLRLTVIFATFGRGAILSRIVRTLDEQTRKPDSIIVSCVSHSDVGDLRNRPDTHFVTGRSGLPYQRNAGLRELPPQTDVVVFFDDDFLPHPRWIETVERHFRMNPSVSAITGNVVYDAIKGPGLSLAEACALLEAKSNHVPMWVRENYSPYGCNMAFRCSAIRGMRFDERLVLYGWLEDRDFGGALSKRGGKSIQLGSAMGVHLGVKASRVSGRRLGYSQVVNPVYLYRKGTMTFAAVVIHLFKNLSRNAVGCLLPERYIDRFGRLYGNAIGIRDLLAGAAKPEYAERL